MSELNIGIIGISEGNGHPFSFSAIINGYSEKELRCSNWPVIYEYMTKRHPSEFGIKNTRVTYAWTQDYEITESLCKACKIPNPLRDLQDMIHKVDGVIIARDDFEKHYDMAIPFLKKKIPVFIDKPLTLNLHELKKFKPYLEEGLLMSCSGMRYARELDNLRSDLSHLGEIKTVNGTILNTWEKYGIHLLDAILPIHPSFPVSILSLDADHSSMVIEMDDRSLLQINCLGKSAPVFNIDIYGTKNFTSISIRDNFTMFSRMLWEFIELVKTKRPVISPEDTLTTMKLLIAGRLSEQLQRKVKVCEIEL